MDKKAFKAAAKKAFAENKMVRVDGINDLVCFVKRFSSREMNEVIARSEGFDKKYDDGLNGERAIMLEIFDKDGAELFDPTDLEDVQFIANLPFVVRQAISRASAKANGLVGN